MPRCPPIPAGAAKARSGGGLSSGGKEKRDKKALSKSEQNRLKRGGKGKRAFKSKARHKRR